MTPRWPWTAHRSWTVESSFSPTGPRLGRTFYDRPTAKVARDLLGGSIHVVGPNGTRTVRIVEVEAYVAGDPASHTFRGPTRRNRSMFGPPGTLYVYRIHQVVCANLVTRAGEAVLVRAGAPGDGTGDPSGPGRLCRYLGEVLSDDGTDTTESARIFVTRGLAGCRTTPSVQLRRRPMGLATAPPGRAYLSFAQW